jgi:phosphatidylglycerophosphatase A|tara:strand:- start:400 stop:909 length:510 start_codon:yes stop_codon:yes gene_type:complete
MINKLNYYFITLFIFGNTIQKYRGTWASLFTTLLLFFAFYILKIEPIFISIVLLLILFCAIFAINSCLKNFTDEDPQEIVIDEFIGQSIPICLYELVHNEQNDSFQETLQIYLLFFLLFRLFDGLKPFPIDYVDKKYKNTFGILFDDILAGVYVAACLILFMVGKTLFF